MRHIKKTARSVTIGDFVLASDGRVMKVVNVFIPDEPNEGTYLFVCQHTWNGPTSDGAYHASAVATEILDCLV